MFENVLSEDFMTFTDQQNLKEELHEYMSKTVTQQNRITFSHWEVTDAEKSQLSYLVVFSEI